jgi:glycosyltransferase involved in cell wall biosynthesis
LCIVRRTIPGVRLLITGSGLKEAQLQQRARQSASDGCFKFLGMLNYQELLATLQTASIGLAPYRRHKFSEYSSPQKIVEYMAAGLPVVATCQGYAQYLLKESGAGQSVEATPQSFAAAILKLLTDSTYYAACVRNARSFAKQYDWEVLLGSYWKLLQEL